MAAGGVIVLNGPSSAGKTTLADAVREGAPATTAVVSIDQLFASFAPSRARDWPLFAALTDATFAAAASLARAGFDVVVDTVFERAECVELARSRLGGLRFSFVAVRCALDVLEAREAARANRPAGQARGQHERVLHNVRYDLVVDTGVTPVADCVARVRALVTR